MHWKKQISMYSIGMSVTNTIRDTVLFNNITGWSEIPLTNEEIESMLEKQKESAFMSFSYGVWCTAWARFNLLSNLIKFDKYLVYTDTDSLKLKEGFNKQIIEDYNESVLDRIDKVSKDLGIDVRDFCPKDKDGNRHFLGVFDLDATYEEFITQGAKKYAYTKWVKLSKIQDKDGNIKQDVNVQKIDGDKALILEITVSGIPKKRSKSIKKFI